MSLTLQASTNRGKSWRTLVDLTPEAYETDLLGAVAALSRLAPGSRYRVLLNNDVVDRFCDGVRVTEEYVA